MNLIPAHKGPFKVWDYPELKYDYVMGIDGGEGLGQEYSVCDVYCRQNGFQVAQFVSNQEDPEEFAFTCIAIGNYYNEALAVIERRNVGDTIVYIFKGNYRRSRIWKQKQLIKVETPKKTNYGFETTKASRPHLIFDWKAAIKNGYVKIRSQTTYNQIRTFIRKNEGRIEHADGECDDCVFAGALAWQGFKDIIPREERSVVKHEGPTTIGEFVKTVRGFDKETKKRDLVIGRDDPSIERSIILRR